MTSRATPSANSPLIDYALKGLERCWLSDRSRWSHIYHLDNCQQPNESFPHSDVFYTLNVLLGMARVHNVPHGIDLRETFQRNALDLVKFPVRKYAFGVALWAGAELQFELPDATLQYIAVLRSDKNSWQSFRAQDIGMLVLGAVAQAKIDPKTWSPFVGELFAFLLERYHSPSGLFFDAPFGLRRRFGSFATQTYLTLACYAYGELTGDLRAIEIANTCTRKLILRQGPSGEWPWFFDAKKGTVVDFYEVYSVHQYGMAPAFLELAERHGVSEARDAIIKGFYWVLGRNQLQVPMLVPELHLTIRSQVRKGELHTKKWRVIRAVTNSMLGLEGRLIDPADVELRRECRSYELGWILWSFGQRSDLTELTHNELFVDRKPAEKKLARDVRTI